MFSIWYVLVNVSYYYLIINIVNIIINMFLVLCEIGMLLGILFLFKRWGDWGLEGKSDLFKR